MKKAAFVMAFLLTAQVPGIFAAVLGNWEEINIISGPRNAALAGAYTALADDADAVFLNPAGLQKFKNVEINASYNFLPLETSAQYVSAVMPLGYGAAGAEFYYLSTGGIQGRDDLGGFTGKTISPYSIGGGFAYGAQATGNLYAGAGIKFAGKRIYDNSYSAWLADIGLLWRVSDAFSAGAVLRNYELFFTGPRGMFYSRHFL